MSQIFDQPDKDPRQFSEKGEQPHEKPREQPEISDDKTSLDRDELPDSSNENRGTTGSGQRQDSN